jgi:hypothetical protein
MAELFGTGGQTINHHLQEIYKSNELNDMASIRKLRIVLAAIKFGTQFTGMPPPNARLCRRGIA